MKKMSAKNRMLNASLLLLVAMLFVVFASEDSEAATHTVDNLGGSDYTNITHAVENASAGDTIRVASRTYHDAVDANKKLNFIGGNYGIDIGYLYDCNEGDLVAKYSLDEINPSEVEDGVWCHDITGEVEGATTSAGIWSNGLDFDGTNDYVEIADDSAFDSDVISITAWVNIDDNDTDFRTIFSKYESTSGSEKGYKALVNSDAKFQFVFGQGSSSGGCSSVKEIPENTWTLLTATYDKSSIKLYIDGELDNSCNYSTSISDTAHKQVIGASDHNNDGTYDDFFDGTLDDVTIWNSAITASNIEKIYWGGDYVKSVVNASGGDYAFKLSADESTLRGFEIQYSGSDVGATGDVGVSIVADEVKLYSNHFRFNVHAIRVHNSDDVVINSASMHCDGSALDKGLVVSGSKRLLVEYGDYQCADEVGISIQYGGSSIFKNIYFYGNKIGIKIDQSTNNYFNESNFHSNEDVGILFFGADNNTVHDTNFNYEKYAISFTREAENNTIRDVEFSNTYNYDIHHGYDSDAHRNGWNNVIIDTTLDDLSIDSNSRLLEKEEVEISVTSNGTYVWNRVNTTIDSDRKANSGLNSFWAGDSNEGTYLDSWSGSFKQKSDISLPSGGVGETRLLEIKTWYETENTYDGGQVYITKNSGSTWQLITPIGGYDGSFSGDCGSTGAFMGDKSGLGWQTKRFNLTGYRGEDIRLKFTFCSDGSEHDFEGWYVDDIKIIKAADESVVTYSEGFERIGYGWIAQNIAGEVNWEAEGTQIYSGINNADVYVSDGNSASIIMNKTSNSNIVNYYKFDESSGVAYDTITPSHYANLYSGASYASGKFGNAVSFDGSNDYARNGNCNFVGSCNGYDHYSMSVWVKFDSFPTGTSYEGIANFRYDADAYLAVNSDGNPVFGAYFWGSPSGDHKIEASTEMVTGVWYHIAGTWSELSDKLRIYVNGTLDGTNTLSGTTAYMRYSQSYNYIGRCSASSTSCNGGYMDGMVDNLAIFNSELSSSQVRSLYDDPLGTNSVLYKTSHFGGSDSKTNSQGKIDNLLILKKIYDGSSSGISYKPYIGFHKDSWTEDPREVTISGGEHSGKLPDSRVYNRNKALLYTSISEAVSAASSQNVIEIWPGHYRESVYVNQKLHFVGSGPSRTIVNARYSGSPFFFDYNADGSTIKNLRVIKSSNTTACCSYGYLQAGIGISAANDMVIDNIHTESYNGIVMSSSQNVVIKNSKIEPDSSTRYYGIRIYSSSFNSIVENNEISGFAYGLTSEYLAYGIEIKDNYIHNNTNYGYYLYQVGTTAARSNPIEITGNRFVDNNYGIYKSDTSSSYSYAYLIKDNLFKSQSNHGIWSHYYSREWVVENNTFDGDNDQSFGIYLNRYSYKSIFGNNTFSDHTSTDMYFYYCGCSGANAVKFFSNSLSTIYNNNGLINVYNNLNIRTLDEDDNAFSNVDIEIKDSLTTYYKTTHWGGTDSRTDSSGYISSSEYIRSGYYSNSNTLNDNTVTVKIAYGVRAKTTSFTFDSDGTENIEVPNNFKQGVIENKETETLYSSFSSAVSAASAGDVLQLWAWNYNNLEVTKGVILRGNSTTTAIVDGGSSDHAIEIKSNSVKIENLTLQGSSDSILFAGNYNNLELQNLTISDIGSDNGIHFDGTSSSTISNVTVNSTKRKAVLFEDVTSITVKNSFFKNSSSSHGFEISDGSSSVILDNVFIHNAGYDGSSAYGLYVSGSSSVTIKNGTKVGNSKSYELYANGASTLKVQNSTFIGPNLALIEDSDGFLIEKSTFKDSSSGDYGVYIKNTDSGAFKDNKILNSASDDGSDYGALYLTGSKTNLLQNNTITNSGRSGIHLKSSSTDNKIYSNTVSSSYFSGLYVQSSDRSIVRNNSFSSSGDNGIKVSSSDGSIIDNNTLSSNTDYGLYISNSDDMIVKGNTASDNNAGMYLSASDDATISSNTVDDHASYGIYFTDSKRLRVKHNEIKNSLGDAVYLSSNCDSAFIDNNTIKSNGNSDSGRSLRVFEVEDSTFYNNTIDSNDYSGIVLTESSNNKIVHNVIKGNGKYGIQILNDATKSANNTIKDNTINDNSDIAIFNHGIFTTIFNNTIKYNEQDGIKIASGGARTTIDSNNLVDNEGKAIAILANNVIIKSNTIDGDSSEIAVSVLNANSVSIENNTIEGGSQGIKVQNGSNAFIYKNTVKSNSGYGIYLLINSALGDVKHNTLTDNEDHAMVISSSNSTEIYNNTAKENAGYGLHSINSKFSLVKGNTFEDNDGGIKYSNCDYCNLTFNKIDDNGGYGLWLLSGSDNNTIKHNTVSDSSTKDVYLQGSTDNSAFNFTFSSIGVDSTSKLTITANLAIVFEDDDDDGFPGIDFALTSDGVTKYSTPFYGGSDSVSDSNGEAGATFSLVYRIYDGSSTPTNIPNILKYHYGVRSKEKSIDMSTSHTETVSVPSYWVKGLVKNINSGSTWYKIQDAIDNASLGNTLHIWAWTYTENVEVDESITIIGNATSNTTLNITSGKGFDISSDDVSISNILVKGCGSTTTNNAFQVSGDDVTIENVVGTTCAKGISVSGSGVWVANSSFINNYHNGVEIWEGTSSTTAVTFYNNNISSNGNNGISITEDNAIIKSNTIKDNTGDGISVNAAADVVLDGNIISDNSDGIETFNASPRVIIKNNVISDSSSNGIKVSSSNSNNGVFENNTISSSGSMGIFINHSDNYYLGNNTISSSGSKDVRFNKATTGNSGKGNNFSTIQIDNSAYFARYNDLTLKFMQDETTGFSELDVKIISDGSTRYSTSGYGGSDSKTNSNGQLSRDFEFKHNEYDGSNTPNLVYTNVSYQYGVRAKEVSINMSTSHTETITVPSFWKNGLVHNLNSGIKYSTIQDAIDGASSGDVLQLWAFEYVEHGIEVTERVTLVGNSTSSVIVNGTWSDSIFDITTNSIVLKNMTIESSANGTTKECIEVSSGSGIVIKNIILKNCYNGIVVKTDNVDITNVTVQDSAKDGIVASASNIDISNVIVKNSGGDGIVISSSSTTLENSTIQNNADDGIVLVANAFIYKNTIKSNSGIGINIGEGSDYARIVSNTIDDNDGHGIFVYESHHVKLTSNVIEDNEDYGLELRFANFTQVHNNSVDDNDGGIKFVSSKYSNVTKSSFNDNNGRGIWFTSSSDSNNIRDSSVSGSTDDDLELDSSEKNTGFNFTFGDGSIDVDSDSDFRLMNSLNIRFIDENDEAFPGLDIELFNHDTVLYATDFFGGFKSTSNSTGYISEELTVAYEIYNGSSTTEDVDTTLQYHYGVRGKTKQIDMSSSHTETITVQSYWTKGLVKNTNTGTNYYKIQDAIDNASIDDILHVWAWTYNENIEIDESISVIGNGTSNTTINGTWNRIITISSDEVTVKNLKLISGSNTTSLVYIDAEYATLERLEIHGGYQAIEVKSRYAKILDSHVAGQSYSGIQVKAQGLNLEIANSIIRNSENNGIYVELGANYVDINNNSIHNNSGSGIRFQSAASSLKDNVVVDNEDWGIQINGRTADDIDNVVTNNTILRNGDGLKLFKQDSVLYSNIIKENDGFGLQIDTSQDVFIWNNTISENEGTDIGMSTGSSAYSIGTSFSSISVSSDSILTLKSYIDLNVTDARGLNISGIDIRIKEGDSVKYSTNYFGGNDPKTDSNGTIATFLINSKEYDGSSSPTIIPTTVSARSNDWVETTIYDPANLIEITVPDLRVLNTRLDDSPLYYNIQTAINNADEGDTIHAWSGTYFENIEISDEITLKGNGTSTIINGTSGTAIEINDNDISIEDLLIISSEKGIFLNAANDITISTIRFTGNEYAIYVEDSQSALIDNNEFDLEEYGIYFTGSSSGATVEYNKFRNATESAIYQSESDENGGTSIHDNTFNDCAIGWQSGSGSNTFSSNTLKDNNYGVRLTGIESYNNMLDSNSFDDSIVAVYIYNTAHDNNLFNNEFDDSDNSDIKLSDSSDTVSFNNTFSDISVSSDANMWIKVYIDVTVYDNSSNTFEGADIQVKQDNLALYSTTYFGGSDDKTNSSGQIDTFLVATDQYNGSSTPSEVITTVTARYSDWISADTYDVEASITIEVLDFRVYNEDTEELFYSINGAIAGSFDGDTIQVWEGTFRELVLVDKELTIVGNGTSKTVINGTFSGNTVTVESNEVSISDLAIVASSSTGSGLYVEGGDGQFINLRLSYNNISYQSVEDFNEIKESDIRNNNLGILLSGDNNIINNNEFSDNNIGIELNEECEDATIEHNEISDSLQSGMFINKAETNVIKFNSINNNSGYGIHSYSASENHIYSNDLSYNSDISLYLESTGNSSIHNNTFIGNDDYPATVTDSYYNVIRDNKFVANDDYFQFFEAGSYNSLVNNTFDESGIILEDSNNQIISDNTISESSENGIKIYKSSSNNYLSGNTISDSDDEDIYIGGSGYQRNNRGYDNIFSTIEVQNNGQFILMDYVNVRTENSEGNMSGNDVQAVYNSEIFYATEYFSGSDPLTDNFGLVPDFLAPVEEYNGSSTPNEILTIITVRYVDWINSFEMDALDDTSLSVFVPELRVKNINTGEESYHIQTSVNNAGQSDTIIVSNGTYYENVVLNVQKITLRGPYANQLNENVIIDAQDNGIAVTISKAEIELFGFNITNSHEEEDVFTSSGVRVLSNANTLAYNRITNSYVGILLEDTSDNSVYENTVDNVEYGIVLTSSDNNRIENNIVLDAGENDIELTNVGYSVGSSNNFIASNHGIDTLKFKNSGYNTVLNHYAVTINLQGSENNSAIDSEFEFVICNSESSLYLKNYFNLNVTSENSPLQGADLKVWDGDDVIYSTDYFGGNDDKTDSSGFIENILAIYKVYDGSSSGTDNTTYIKVRYGDWFLSVNEVFDEHVTISVDVPVFRVYNTNSEDGYNYIQRAIDNASAGDEIILSSGTFNENIVIDKELTLTGSGIGTIITVQPPFGMGSPPIADWTVPGINVTSSGVTISNILISNFSVGIIAFQADSLSLNSINIEDIQGVGIHIDSSVGVTATDMVVTESSSSNILVERNSTDVSISNSLIGWSEESGIVVREGSDFFEMSYVSVEGNEDYGCLISSDYADLSNVAITNNGLNGIYLTSSFGSSIIDSSFKANGLSELKIIQSNTLLIENSEFNATEQDGGGWGIDVSSSLNVDIHLTYLELGIRFTDTDDSYIRDNYFDNINHGSNYDQKTSILLSDSFRNKILDNEIYNVGLGFVLLGESNNNSIENNTVEAATTDIEYYSSGINNTFINTEIDIVDILETSYFEILNYIDIQMYTVNGPVEGVELSITTDGNPIFVTEHYGGDDETTFSDGFVGRLFLVNEIYNGNWIATKPETIVEYYYDDEGYSYTLNTDTSGYQKIYVNLRPTASIDYIKGIGENASLSGIEAVKGADKPVVDEYTTAYWSFDEGEGSDASGTFTSGSITPSPLWEEGRQGLESDFSIVFDGLFTKLTTDITLKNQEFTGEVWFKTSSSLPMVIFSDNDASGSWGHSLYIDGGSLGFDFTVDGGSVVRLDSSEVVTDGDWHNAVVVRGEDYVELWLDGEFLIETSYDGVVDDPSSVIYVGQNPLGGELFSGNIDDLKFSNIPRHHEDFMSGVGVVEFSSLVNDEDGVIIEYEWRSSRDGILGNEKRLFYSVDDLTEGTHTITLEVTDNNGTKSNIDSIPLTVMMRPDAYFQSVKVNQESVSWGWGPVSIFDDEFIEVKGASGTSPGLISEYYWSSDLDGKLADEITLDTDELSNGTHIIKFSIKATNGLWSPVQTLLVDVNGRPVIEANEVDLSDTEILRMGSANFKVPVQDDSTAGNELDYQVSYRVDGGTWQTDYISNVSFNDQTSDVEFDFSPDVNAETGDYEFRILADDGEGGTQQVQLTQTINVQNNAPEIELDDVPLEFEEGETIDFGVEVTDVEGGTPSVVWYADCEGQCTEADEIGTGSNFSFANSLAPGDHTIKVRILDSEGGYKEQEYNIVVKAAPESTSLVETAIADLSSNLPLFASAGVGLVMILGTLLLRRRSSAEPVVEGLVVDDGVSPQQQQNQQLPPPEVLDWEIPTDAQGQALIIGEYMAKRRESYLKHPDNDEVLDYLHNNRERFTISTYFEVPNDPTTVISDWALPENLRGNVHLDSFRQQIVERITNSSPDKNFVIIGEPGVGKTVMLFEVFDRLMNKAPVGILSTDTVAKAHELFGVRVFYDDIPENQELVEALTENDVKGVIVSSREADWKALPTEMQAKFDRLTVPLFSELDMKAMIEKMMGFQSIGHNDEAISILAEYSEGSPIYVWSMVREMMHRSVKTLTKEYIEENSVKGMLNYVAQLLQRLLKDGEEYRKGGLHALASLIFLSDHMEERYCNDYFFDAYVEVLSKYTEEKLDDKMNPKTLNLVLAYLPINDSVIRFPHDTWPDVLQGWGDMNPFSTELRMINRAFADSGIFQDLKKEVVKEVWDSTYERYKRTPSRQKNSFLALADTLFQNFTIDELKELGVDIDIVRQVASTYSHIPQAAKLISKIQAVLPQTVTRIINMQDIGSESSHAPYKIQEMYLIYNDGRMLSSLMDEEAKVDEDIMSSMLTAINDFVKDSFQTTGNLGSIDYGENQIILERGKHTMLASVVYGESNRDLRSRMSRALTKIEDEFKSDIKDWNGDVDSLSGTVKHLQPIMDISKSVTKDMIDELQALKSVNLRSSWTQVAGFVQVNILINNYSKKQLKGAKLTLEYGADFMKLVKTEPEFKYKVTEIDIKKVPANDEMPVTLYFEPLKSAQASLNVHLDYESKGGNASGVSSAVFERVNLYKEGQSLNIADIENAAKAEIVPEAKTGAEAEPVVEAEVVVEADAEPIVEAEVVVEAEAEVVDPGESGVDDIMSKLNELDGDNSTDGNDSGPSDGDDDLMSKLNELDDPENKPKKKEKKSDDEEDASGMDDLLGKLDEL